MSTIFSVGVLTVGLLILSNSFMTLAWYGHLKYPYAPLLLTVLASWLIALPEYLLQVPANRYGNRVFTTEQLKIIQEVISLSVFVAFNYLYFDVKPTWRTVTAFSLIAVAIFLLVHKTPAPQQDSEAGGDSAMQTRRE